MQQPISSSNRPASAGQSLDNELGSTSQGAGGSGISS